MGIDDGVPIYYSLAEVQLNCTVLTVCTVPMSPKILTAAGRSNQVEHYPEESCESEGWTDDPYGY